MPSRVASHRHRRQMVPVRAAFDIGSSHHKLTVARLHPKNPLVLDILHSSSIRVPLADALRTSSSSSSAAESSVNPATALPDEALTASWRAVTELKARAKAHGATVFSAVATAVFRAASNGPLYLTRLSATHAIHISVLSAEDEGALAFRTAYSLASCGVRVVRPLLAATLPRLPFSVPEGAGPSVEDNDLCIAGSASGSEGSTTDGDGLRSVWEDDEEEEDGNEKCDVTVDLDMVDGDDGGGEEMDCLEDGERMLMAEERSVVVWDAGGGSTQWTHRADDGSLGVHGLAIGSAVVRSVFMTALASAHQAGVAARHLSAWVRSHALPMTDASLTRKISSAPYILGLGSPTSLFGLASSYAKTPTFTRADVYRAISSLILEYDCHRDHDQAQASDNLCCGASSVNSEQLSSDLPKLVLLFELMLVYDIHSVRWLQANGSCVGLLTAANDPRFWPSL